MPIVDVDIDIDDYLDEASTGNLKQELESRGYCVSEKNEEGFTWEDYRIPSKEIMHILRESSDILRKNNQISLAYKLDELANGRINSGG